MKPKSKNYQVRLGSFVVVLTLLLLGSIYFISKNENLFNNTIRLSTIVSDLGGIQIGDDVRYNGINAGTIEGMRIINDTSIIVYFLLDNDYQKFIRKGSVAVITSEGLMGSKALNILPGSPQNHQVAEGDTLLAEKPIGVNDVITGLKITMDNASLIGDNISSIAEKMQRGKGTIGKLMYDKQFSNNLNATVSNINDAKAELKGDSADAGEKQHKKKKGFHLFGKHRKDTTSGE